jgi:hypothetical protein
MHSINFCGTNGINGGNGQVYPGRSFGLPGMVTLSIFQHSSIDTCDTDYI